MRRITRSLGLRQEFRWERRKRPDSSSVFLFPCGSSMYKYSPCPERLDCAIATPAMGLRYQAEENTLPMHSYLQMQSTTEYKSRCIVNQMIVVESSPKSSWIQTDQKLKQIRMNHHHPESHCQLPPAVTKSYINTHNQDQKSEQSSRKAQRLSRLACDAKNKRLNQSISLIQSVPI